MQPVIYTSVQQAAADYRAKGFRVVPLYGVDADGICRCPDPACLPRNMGKHEPPETDGQWKGSGRVFTAEDFTAEQNIALAMGPWDGEHTWLVALDVDGHDDINAFFYPRLPETLTQLTPNGAHFIFQVPAKTPLGNWVNVFGGGRDSIKLDVRYARGRIVVPPSRGCGTRGTGKYEWLRWQKPAVLPSHAIDSILDVRRAQRLPVQDEWDRKGKEP